MLSSITASALYKIQIFKCFLCAWGWRLNLVLWVSKVLRTGFPMVDCPFFLLNGLLISLAAKFCHICCFMLSFLIVDDMFT